MDFGFVLCYNYIERYMYIYGLSVEIGVWRILYEECSNIKNAQSRVKQIMMVSDPGGHSVSFLLYHP